MAQGAVAAKAKGRSPFRNLALAIRVFEELVSATSS
jgi:hypothetical protein